MPLSLSFLRNDVYSVFALRLIESTLKANSKLVTYSTPFMLIELWVVFSLSLILSG